jgi:hypothetical protein
MLSLKNKLSWLIPSTAIALQFLHLALQVPQAMVAAQFLSVGQEPLLPIHFTNAGFLTIVK